MKIIHLVFKDIRLFMKQKINLVLTFVIPMILAVIFGAIFGGFSNDSGMEKIKVLLTDNDKSAFSNSFVEELKNIEEITVYRYFIRDHKEIPFTVEEMNELIKKGSYPIGISLPKGSEQLLKDGKELVLNLHIDPKHQIEYGILSGLIQKMIPAKFPQIMFGSLLNMAGDENMKTDIQKTVQSYYPEANLSYFNNKSIPFKSSSSSKDSTGFQGMNSPVKINTIKLLGEKKSNGMYAQYISGMAVMFLLFTVSGTASTLLEERQIGTLKRLLIAPISSNEILFSKQIYTNITGFIQLTVMFIFGWIVFSLDIFSNVFALLFTIISTTLACSSLGILLATLFKTQKEVSNISILVVLGMSALGGSMVPSFVMPSFVNNIGKFTINHWAMRGFTNIFWREQGLAGVLKSNLILLGIFAVFTLLANYFYKRRLFTDS